MPVITHREVIDQMLFAAQALSDRAKAHGQRIGNDEAVEDLIDALDHLLEIVSDLTKEVYG